MRLASLPVPSTVPLPVSSLCFCAYLGATPLGVEGIRDEFLQGPISLQGSNDPCANSLLKPEKVLAPRHGNHPELVPFGLFASTRRFWPRALDALVAEGHSMVLWDCFSKHLLHSRLPP